MIIAKQTSSGSDFKLPPAGSFMARLYRIIDIGTQTTEWMGKKKMQRKIICMFELHGEDNDGQPLQTAEGKPLIVSKRYTLSLDEKATLRKDLEAWRGKAFTQEEMRKFDLQNILGAWCMLNIIERQGQNGNTYSNVSSVTPVPSVIKQSGLPQPINKNEMFNLQKPDMAIFETFSENLKTKITSSPEWEKFQGKISIPDATVPPSSQLDPDEDIPF